MAKTHEICWPRLWWYRSFLPPAWSWTRLDPHAPTYSVACAYEIDEPFRASRSVVIRLAFTRGIIFHWWEVNPESLVEYNDGRWIERHLLRALNSTKGSKSYQDSVTIDDETIEVVTYDSPEEAEAGEDFGYVRLYNSFDQIGPVPDGMVGEVCLDPGAEPDHRPVCNDPDCAWLCPGVAQSSTVTCLTGMTSCTPRWKNMISTIITTWF